MNTELLVNPFIETFLDLVRKSEVQMFASPFIKDNVAQMIIQNKPKSSNVSILTSYKLSNFHRKSSDVAALKKFVNNNIPVRNCPNLHAKIYIFGNSDAIVTSANLTMGGLKNNYECGLLINDATVITKLKREYKKIFLDEVKTSSVTDEILNMTEEILAKVPKEKKILFEKSNKDLFPKPVIENEDDIYDGGIVTIKNSLTGWRLDVFEILTQIQPETFKLNDAYNFADHLKKLHPENKNIKAKIRQQLQYLRDLGILEFRDRGIYRKLWKNA